MTGCTELEYCLWVGEPGECIENPCFSDQAEACGALNGETCGKQASCMFVGDPGECVLNVCAPCELLDQKICTDSPFCDYDEGEMACVPLT
jgi:hypothetical protein